LPVGHASSSRLVIEIEEVAGKRRERIRVKGKKERKGGQEGVLSSRSSSQFALSSAIIALLEADKKREIDSWEEGEKREGG